MPMASTPMDAVHLKNPAEKTKVIVQTIMNAFLAMSVVKRTVRREKDLMKTLTVASWQAESIKQVWIYLYLLECCLYLKF